MELDVKKILNKKFEIDLKGYNAYEVDSFLDSVIDDYEKFEKIINEKNQKINDLSLACDKLKENLHLKQTQLNELIKQIQILESKGLSNMDLLKRVNKLEEKEELNKK